MVSADDVTEILDAIAREDLPRAEAALAPLRFARHGSQAEAVAVEATNEGRSVH